MEAGRIRPPSDSELVTYADYPNPLGVAGSLFPLWQFAEVHLYRLIPGVAGRPQEVDLPSHPDPVETSSGTAKDQGWRG